VCLQRLYSTFAGGWPGTGILLQRLLTAGALFYCAIAHPWETPVFPAVILPLVAAGAGIFLLVGLCTPIVGVLIAIVEMWIAFLRADGLLLPILLTMLSASLAMIGPGAWSIDARLFGRKHIKTPSI
jgi:putative oxidoreductase